jgi:hypothetical protein
VAHHLGTSRFDAFGTQAISPARLGKIKDIDVARNNGRCIISGLYRHEPEVAG